MNIKELPLSERPYEKLEIYGPEKLSNAELIAIIIKNGTKDENSLHIAQRILSLEKSSKNNLKFLQEISINELMKIKGIGKVKALQIKAIGEISKRISNPMNITNIRINSPRDVANLLMDEMKYNKRECVKAILLNIKNVVVKIVDICYGGTNSAILKPKDILHEAIRIEAPKIILVHNHPSGDPTPSKQDNEFTDNLIKASEIMGIELLDHIIIGDQSFRSIFYLKSRNN